MQMEEICFILFVENFRL